MKLKPADFARQAGVSKQAISAKIKNKTLIVDPAGFMDTDNPVNSAYISDPRRKSRQNAVIPFPAANHAPAANLAASAESAATDTPPAPMPTTEEDMANAAGVPAVELLNYTLRDVVLKFNGIYGLEKHARILQNLTTAADREQRMAERSMRLIPKDFVTSRIFPFLNSLMKQIIEYPEAGADKLIAKALADGPAARETIVAMIRDDISRIITRSKDQIIKEIESLRGRHSIGGDRPEGTPGNKDSAGEQNF